MKSKTPTSQPSTPLYVGMCDINSSMGSTLIVLSHSEDEAKRLLVAEFKRHVYAGFMRANGLKTFDDLHDWNGASVRIVPIGKAVVWEQLP